MAVVNGRNSDTYIYICTNKVGDIKIFSNKILLIRKRQNKKTSLCFSLCGCDSVQSFKRLLCAHSTDPIRSTKFEYSLIIPTDTYDLKILFCCTHVTTK